MEKMVSKMSEGITSGYRRCGVAVVPDGMSGHLLQCVAVCCSGVAVVLQWFLMAC